MVIPGDKSLKVGVIGQSTPKKCTIKVEGGHCKLYAETKGFDQDLQPGYTRGRCLETNSHSTEIQVNMGIDGVKSPQRGRNRNLAVQKGLSRRMKREGLGSL